MKKTICIILACFLLVMTPIKGYASSAPLVFGLGEEVILPFLLSLLGVQAVNQIDSYDDLVSYNNEVYDSLIESLSGLAGIETIQAWLLKAVQGTIDTDSIIWQKLYEYAVSQYVVASGNAIVPSGNVLSTPSFEFIDTSSAFVGNTTFENINSASCYYGAGNSRWFTSLLCASDTYQNSFTEFTYNGLTVYYIMTTITSFGSSYSVNASPAPIFDTALRDEIGRKAGKCAWLMVYGGYSAVTDNAGSISLAYDNVLNAQQKDDIVDGTSVIQLYNPSDEQNGLHFVPDPEEPDDIKIPFAVTADWWNYLKQFGNDAKEQVVQAYNALNGISGNSIGSISDAYDRLGIASVLSSAQSAAEGIASLTDSNVYPNSLTVADAINNSIPSSLTPQTPDDGIDNESEQGLYKLPDLRDYFPFCIPFDLIDLLSCFVAEPETPSFVIALSTGEETVSGNMDLHIWDNIAGVIRTFELIGFTVGLILITRNIIRG